MNFWDQQFGQTEYKYGVQANAFVCEQAHVLAQGGQVLVPGDGEGRNGVWLAEQGHRVHSVDLSTVGLAKAQRLALERGVTLQTETVDLATWSPAPEQFDALVLTYVHLPQTIRQATHVRLWAGLKPGGVWLLEAFTPQQLAYASGGPKAPEMLYTLDMLRSDLGVNEKNATEVVAWEGEVTLDEGPGHQGPAHVVRYVLRKA